MLLLGVAAGALWQTPVSAEVAPARDDTCPGPGIRALVNDQSTGSKVPIEGVVIKVSDQAGAAVAEGKTDAKGIALVCVPEKATYTVEVDSASLPDGEVIDGEGKVVVEKDRFTTNIKTVSFFAGKAQRVTEGYWALLAKSLVNGVRLGIVIAICSVGLSLIFGTTGLTNFAHGELVTFGGLVAHLLSVTWGINFIVAAVLTVLLGGLFGLGLNQGLWLPLRRRGIGLISQMVVSVGLSIMFVNLYLMRFGGATKRYQAFNDQK
ncbi:MAG: ABC transporter permease subunit, partial [Actinomycetota bacterium]